MVSDMRNMMPEDEDGHPPTHTPTLTHHLANEGLAIPTTIGTVREAASKRRAFES